MVAERTAHWMIVVPAFEGVLPNDQDADERFSPPPWIAARARHRPSAFIVVRC